MAHLIAALNEGETVASVVIERDRLRKENLELLEALSDAVYMWSEFMKGTGAPASCRDSLAYFRNLIDRTDRSLRAK